MHRPLLPAPLRPALPLGAADGAVIQHAGRYARESVLLAFEMIGGVERLADWAAKNPTEFYTRLYTKVITREVEVHASEGVEELLLRLDARPHPTSGASPQEAEYEVIEE
jgi:hypothetical protein